MDIYVKNTGRGFIPAYDSDYEAKQNLKVGEIYRATIKRPRNLQFHKKYFALLNLAHTNTSLNMPFESYRRFVQIKAGYFNAYKTQKGIFYDSKSISFGSMSQDEFETLYSRVLDVVMSDLGSTKEEIEENLVNFM